MSLEFSAENRQKCQKLVARYERPQSALLPVLYLAQEQFGHLSSEAMELVARVVDLPPNHVFDAASFYTMFKKEPTGKFCLQICRNVTCTLMGSDRLIESAEAQLGVKVGGTSSDKQVTLGVVECLGACDKAPVACVDDVYVEGLDEGGLKDLIANLKRNQPPKEDA